MHILRRNKEMKKMQKDKNMPLISVKSASKSSKLMADRKKSSPSTPMVLGNSSSVIEVVEFNSTGLWPNIPLIWHLFENPL